MLNHFNRDRSSKQSQRSKSTDAQVSGDNEDFLFIAILVFFLVFLIRQPCFQHLFQRYIPAVGTIYACLDGCWGREVLRLGVIPRGGQRDKVWGGSTGLATGLFQKRQGLKKLRIGEVAV